MPAGVSWGKYFKFMSCALLSMCVGSQVVHIYYKPLKDLDYYIKEELKRDPTIDSKSILESLNNRT